MLLQVPVHPPDRIAQALSLRIIPPPVKDRYAIITYTDY